LSFGIERGAYMADFIYNDFSSESGEGLDSTTFDNNSKRVSKSNIMLIIVSGFFALMLILMLVFGIIIVDRLSTPGSGKNVDSLIFTSPGVDDSNGPSGDNSSGNNVGSDSTTNTNKEYSSYSEVIYAVKDSVVEIKTEFVVNSVTVSASAGSGVIIGKYKLDGIDAGYYVVTNAHVIQDDNGKTSNKITIRTTDGKEYAVKTVRGTDSYGDIAVLMVETGDKLFGAKFGDSNAIVLGQEVIAIGNPLGELGGTVTNGIISALDREIEIDGNYFNLLQTNAAINSGNSGGGLFNMKGELIGIVNAKSSGLGVEGIGFAIPSNDARIIVEDIIEFGYNKSSPFLGITVSEVSSGFSSYVYVHDLTKGFNDTSLQVQDIILQLNGVDISSLNDFRSVLSRTKPGDTIHASIKRGNEYLNVDIIVYERVS
jgi:serine protease Do